MIVRIQGEGQWELTDSQATELERLDEDVLKVVKRHDEGAFESMLADLLEFVRINGRALPPEEIRESDLILPPSDATLDEVTKTFADEGLIPG